jgi:hypothetical protein
VRVTLRVLAITVLLVLTVTPPLHADWQFTPFLGYTFKGSTTLYDPLTAADDTQWNLGGAVTWIGDSPLGIEGYFVWTPTFFQGRERLFNLPGGPTVTESRTYAFMGNVVLATPRSWNRYGLRPFVSGGLGSISASHDETELPVRINLLGMNVGGGAVGFLTDRVGVRFDLRYFRNVRGVSDENRELAPTIGGEFVRLRYWTLSIGVVIKR